MKQHAANAWWLEVDQSRTTVHACISSRAAARLEGSLIERIQPRHNRAGVTGVYVPYRPPEMRQPRPASTGRGAEALAKMSALAEEWNQRAAIVRQARAERETWQSIADALHMTPNGVRKLAGYRRDPNR